MTSGIWRRKTKEYYKCFPVPEIWFEEDGLEYVYQDYYHCMEQYMMAEKAHLFNDKKIKE